jgi:hypothetical protein
MLQHAPLKLQRQLPIGFHRRPPFKGLSLRAEGSAAMKKEKFLCVLCGSSESARGG